MGEQQRAIAPLSFWFLSPTLLRGQALGKLLKWPWGGLLRTVEVKKEALHPYNYPGPHHEGAKPSRNLSHYHHIITYQSLITKWHFHVLVPYIVAIPSMTPRTPQNIWIWAISKQKCQLHIPAEPGWQLLPQAPCWAVRGSGQALLVLPHRRLQPLSTWE